MNDFFRAEWKTLAIFAVGVGLLFWALVGGEEVKHLDPQSTLRPAEGAGEIELGMSETEVRAALGAPERVRQLPLGIVEGTYGATKVYLHGQPPRVTAVRLEVDEAGEAVLPTGTDVYDAWSRSQGELGPPRYRMAFEGVEWRRFPGLIAVLDANDEGARPHAFIVVRDASQSAGDAQR